MMSALRAAFDIKIRAIFSPDAAMVSLKAAIALSRYLLPFTPTP
jgi:hypothetical protein